VIVPFAVAATTVGNACPLALTAAAMQLQLVVAEQVHQCQRCNTELSLMLLLKQYQRQHLLPRQLLFQRQLFQAWMAHKQNRLSIHGLLLFVKTS